MASHGKAEYKGYEVSEDLSSKKYYFMKIGASDNSALLNDSLGGYVVGVLDEEIDGSSNTKTARLNVDGFGKVKLSGTVARGGEIVSAADGTGVASSAADQFVVGHAEQSGVSGDIIEFKWTRETAHA